MMHSVPKSLVMSYSDKKELKQLSDKITDSGDLDIFMAGHVHGLSDWKYEEGKSDKITAEKTGENKTKKTAEEHHIKRVLVSSKFYDEKKKKIYGYLIKGINEGDLIIIRKMER